MASLDRVKVLVLGDSGVGKSSLVHLLCHSQVLGNPSWTVGCSVDIRVHDYKEGTPEEKTYYIELWDIGGSVGSASSVKSTRAVFYNSVNGIILVHDLTNKKSSQNLYRWSLEVLNRDLVPTGVLVTNGDYDREQFADNQIPLLVIGTKLDQIHETKRHEVLTRTAFLAEDFNAEEINLVCVFTNVCLGDILVNEASYSKQSPQTQSRAGSASGCHVRVSLAWNLHTDLLEPSNYVLQIVQIIESFLRKLKKHTKFKSHID
ncbi:rab-like protein 3 isoform X1 [Arvicola amphibius]|uniref:rab-like protein 3 isoform X1 n=1 Tax=Arvicola amphibius TaxID=1047088 RepID=UPI0018E29DF2|nr:rab-like protein 3 isoform X1 [Arvicola amphibius]